MMSTNGEKSDGNKRNRTVVDNESHSRGVDPVSKLKMKGIKTEALRVVNVVPPTTRQLKSEDVSIHGVNLGRLETDSLRRYLRHYKIEGINSDSSREQMLNAVHQHFASQPSLDERRVIPEFVHAAVRRRLNNKD